jgi:hypothetical protein
MADVEAHVSSLDQLLSAVTRASPPDRSGLPALLAPLYAGTNGFYLFDDALHVFSTEHARSWNSPTLWRDAYKDMVRPTDFFFAEDVFGSQFAVRDNAIYIFEPETGAFELLAHDIESWAQKILDDLNYLTGRSLAIAWRSRHGAIEPGRRLAPITPFFLGGEYVVENLFAASSVESMRCRGDIAMQTRDLPDGSKVQIKIVD